MYKFLKFMISALILLAITTACASPANTGNDKGNVEDNNDDNNLSDEAFTIMIPNYYNDVEKEQWNQVITEFSELNEGVEVEIVTGDVKVESGKLQTLLQSGVNVPDAVLMNAGPSRVSVLSDAGLIKPLDELYSENDWESGLRPFVYDLISGGEHIYEVPHMIDAIAYYYNKSVFADLDLEEPKSYDDFTKILQTVESESDIAPITVGARNGYAVGWLFGAMLETNAGTEKVENVLFQDGKWDDNEFVEVAELLKEWMDKGYIIKEAVTLEESDAKFSFLNGGSALYVAGTYLITELSEEDMQDEVGFFMAPSKNENQEANPIGGIGQTWVVPSEGGNDSVVEKWLEFIMSEDYAEIVYSFEDYNFILASSNSLEVTPSGEVLKEAAENIEENSGYNPSVFIGPETGEVYYQNLQGLVGDLIEPKEAMKAIEQAAEMDKEAGFKVEIEK